MRPSVRSPAGREYALCGDRLFQAAALYLLFRLYAPALTVQLAGLRAVFRLPLCRVFSSQWEKILPRMDDLRGGEPGPSTSVLIASCLAGRRGFCTLQWPEREI